MPISFLKKTYKEELSSAKVDTNIVSFRFFLFFIASSIKNFFESIIPAFSWIGVLRIFIPEVAFLEFPTIAGIFSKINIDLELGRDWLSSKGVVNPASPVPTMTKLYVFFC